MMASKAVRAPNAHQIQAKVVKNSRGSSDIINQRQSGLVMDALRMITPPTSQDQAGVPLYP